MEIGMEQIARGAALNTIKITVTQDGKTATHELAPGENLAIAKSSAVVVDASGLILKVGVAGGDITFTNSKTGDVYTLKDLGGQLTSESSTLGLFDNTTGAIDDVAIADILSGVSTAAGKPGDGSSLAPELQENPLEGLEGIIEPANNELPVADLGGAGVDGASHVSSSPETTQIVGPNGEVILL